MENLLFLNYFAIIDLRNRKRKNREHISFPA